MSLKGKKGTVKHCKQKRRQKPHFEHVFYQNIRVNIVLDTMTAWVKVCKNPSKEIQQICILYYMQEKCFIKKTSFKTVCKFKEVN